MYMRNHYIFLIIGLLAAHVGHGQISARVISMDTLVSEVRPADFHPMSPVVDSNANVVVLRDSGSADLEGGFVGWQVTQKRYRRLLIRNKNGFDAAKVNLSYDLAINLFGIGFQGYTCNLVGDSVVKTEIDTGEIFLEMTSGGWMKERIAFPNVKEGSIIEYSYSIVSHSIYTFHPWTFQGEYPCLKSTYRMSFPETFNYVVTTQGFLPVSRKDEARDTVYGMGTYTIKTKSYNIQWEMDDVPAFKAEPYISAPDNYTAGLRFQLSEYTDLQTRRRIKVLNTWDEVNKNLYKSKSFGGIMTTSSHWLRKEMRAIVDDSVNAMDKARAVYAYVRDHFTNLGRHILADEDQSLKDIFKSHRGSVAEINLLLTAMLREEGLTADAVILSTRDNGKITPSYPVMENFNYVVVRLRIEGGTYFLDAAEPRMGFGHLPADCYNGYARVVSEKPDSAYLDADSLSESKISTLMLTNTDHGDSLTGAYSAQQGYYGSEDIRDEIADKDEKTYFEAERKSYPFAVEMTDRRVDSLKQYDLPVTIHYSIGFSIGDEDRIYFSPMMGEGMKENLFSAAERHYPIEMPFRMDELFVMRMEIPKGYEIEEMPKPARVLLGDGDGSYEYLFQTDDESIQFRSRLVLKRTYFQADAYQPLRDFYTVVMKKQGEVIVFRKKK
jgi:Domain of Unknown Function with PDB structure (DUF3857)